MGVRRARQERASRQHWSEHIIPIEGLFEQEPSHIENFFFGADQDHIFSYTFAFVNHALYSYWLPDDPLRVSRRVGLKYLSHSYNQKYSPMIMCFSPIISYDS